MAAFRSSILATANLDLSPRPYALGFSRFSRGPAMSSDAPIELESQGELDDSALEALAALLIDLTEAEG